MNKVTVLKEGYSYVDDKGQWRADGSITLITGGGIHVLVDTGLPADKDYLIKALADLDLAVKDITFVVGTHGHSDHIGNLNLFGPATTFIVSYDISQGDVYLDNKLKEGQSYFLNEDIHILPTPGHTGADVSVVVRNTDRGTVVVAGDLFENQEDLVDESLWRDVSENPGLQAENRQCILQIADFIIPGHGPGFSVNKNG